MKITLLSGSDSRKSGGLYNSVRCLADSLNRKQVRAQILAHRDEFSNQDVQAYGTDTLCTYSLQGPANFGYSPDISKVLGRQKPDIIHTQCLWMYLSKVSLQFYKKYRIPHIISPRGMLDPWAVKHSAWKKKIVAAWFENHHLQTAACLHALNQPEADAIRRYGLTNPIAIIPNGIDLPPTGLNQESLHPKWLHRIPPHKKILLYLGRIHPKKGLSNLIRAWAELRSSMRDWCLIIAGWDENRHRAELEEIVKSEKVSNEILFVGSQLGKDKAASYLHADAFILPSYSEGLPMSVLEAWSYKLPVLMTPQCNLPEGFQTNAALSFEPTLEDNCQALQKLVKLSGKDRSLLGQNGHELVKERFTWEKIAKQMIKVYEWVKADSDIPDCVILN